MPYFIINVKSGHGTNAKDSVWVSPDKCKTPEARTGFLRAYVDENYSHCRGIVESTIAPDPKYTKLKWVTVSKAKYAPEYACILVPGAILRLFRRVGLWDLTFRQPAVYPYSGDKFILQGVSFADAKGAKAAASKAVVEFFDKQREELRAAMLEVERLRNLSADFASEHASKETAEAVKA